MSKRIDFDVLVVGAGPAGIAAACCAAESDCRVAIVDDNPATGGQIWRGAGTSRQAKGRARQWLARLDAANVTRLASTRVVDICDDGLLLTCVDGSRPMVKAGKIILACGMRERFIPFPGWTHPQVLGVGGLQAMIKGGMAVAGKRIVIAGSGPLLLAVGAEVKRRGGTVVAIAEQAPRARITRLGLKVLGHPAKAVQAAALTARLLGTPMRYSTWPSRVEPTEHGELRIHLRQGGREFALHADVLACAFGLVPNLELPALLDCRMAGRKLTVDELTQTSRPGVFAPGLTSTGSGGVDQSLLEGQIAGYAAAGRTPQARALLGKRRRIQAFATALDRAYALDERLRRLADDQTIVCRCEDVTHAQLKHFSNPRYAKLQTRCGMGPCQGRTCGPASELLYDWPMADRVRPPIFPVTVEQLSRKGADDPAL